MLKSKNAWRQRGNLLLYLPSRPVKPQPCSPDWQEASFVISKMYAWPCNAVMFDLAIKNESYLALKCGMNQPCPSLFIALVHLWKHDLVTSIYSLISALCVFHNINIWCKYEKYEMFMKYISILCKYIHSTWTWTFWMKPPRPAASSLSMYLWAFFYFCRLFHIIPSVFPFELILLSTSSQSSIFVHIIFISLLDYSSGGETSHHALCLKNINE